MIQTTYIFKKIGPLLVRFTACETLQFNSIVMETCTIIFTLSQQPVKHLRFYALYAIENVHGFFLLRSHESFLYKLSQIIQGKIMGICQNGNPCA